MKSKDKEEYFLNFQSRNNQIFAPLEIEYIKDNLRNEDSIIR